MHMKSEYSYVMNVYHWPAQPISISTALTALVFSYGFYLSISVHIFLSYWAWVLINNIYFILIPVNTNNTYAQIFIY